MKIPKKVNFKKDLHLTIFTLFNDLLHWGLTPSDLKILSELYNIDYDMIAEGTVKDRKDRMAILFSLETKKGIMERLDMSYNTFNNSLSKLRKKGLIEKDNSINERRIINLGKDVFSFIIEFQDTNETIEEKNKD